MKNYLLTDKIIFDSKPDAVPYNYRISYKLAQICLILAMSCRGRSGCSLVKLHIMSSALNTKDDMDTLKKYVDEKSSYILVRFDPAINRAVKYAIADNLIFQLGNGSLRLSEKGKLLVKAIKEDELMIKEKEYLSKIGNRLTSQKIENLISAWRYSNVEDK